jgi:hypothetical protein
VNDAQNGRTTATLAAARLHHLGRKIAQEKVSGQGIATGERKGTKRFKDQVIFVKFLLQESEKSGVGENFGMN